MILSTQAEECSKTVSSAIKQKVFQNSNYLSRLWYYSEYQKSEIDLMDKEKSLNWQNNLYSTFKNPADLQVQDG